jgi:hypothetical protein
MSALLLAVLLLTPELRSYPTADSTLLPDIRVRPFGKVSAMVSVKGHLGQQPVALYIDPPGVLPTWVGSLVETSRNGIDFSPLPRGQQLQERAGRWFIPGELSDLTTCYRMRWKDAEGGEHASGVLLAKRCRDGVVDAVCAAPFTYGESIGLEVALRQRAFLRVVLTEKSSGRPQLLFRGMAEEGVGRWELGAGIEIRPGIWEMTVLVNGTERMRFEIEI